MAVTSYKFCISKSSNPWPSIGHEKSRIYGFFINLFHHKNIAVCLDKKIITDTLRLIAPSVTFSPICFPFHQATKHTILAAYKRINHNAIHAISSRRK